MNSSNRLPGTPWIEVSFSDSGHGIEKEDLSRVFYPFFTTKDRGSGLGLSIVHRVIETHRGRVHVESQPGRGTRMTLLLRVGEDDPLAGTDSQRSI